MIFCEKKITAKLLFAFLCCSLLLAACDKSETNANNLTPEDQKISWSKSRESSFYNYSFDELSKEEAEELLTDKLQLAYTETLTSASEVLMDQLAETDKCWVESIQYTISSNKKETNYGEYWTFKTSEGYYPLYVQTQTIYTYNEEEKLAYASREVIEVKNVTSTGEFNGKDLKKLISQLSGVYNIPEKDFSVKLSEVLQQTDDTTVLYDTLEAAEKEKVIGKKLYIKRAENGIVSQIVVVMEDNSH
ncbi:hypothetical protein [Enterococcus sp. BWR-S5]|uniref:hypothetical protein n=1 Tax=Enterococcus sp. BWR-S5 TaxID=2787714 RepID=UPI0019209C8B|nr:hypothetical protein [Enterococcus sp. BWR-S5]MBL1225614.1 hypothetical protein [Enterococcus sp. BWR-S5]